MQNVPGTGAGVTQMNNLKARQTITVGGVDWKLRRDATDPSTDFAHNKVNWLNTGCAPIMEGRVHVCWIMGVIAPAPGSLQMPVSVMYLGFHQQQILMQPQALSQADLDRMHVYVSSPNDFVAEFTNKFLGKEPEAIGQREHISAWPPGIDMPEDEPVPAPTKKTRVTTPEASEVSDDAAQ